MNRLSCAVKSCCHNADHCCELNKIHVEGPGARDMAQTCCASFASRGSGAANSCGCGQANPELAIDCKAVNCSHNVNKKCEASDVSVGCGCSTPCVMSETECCTFQSR